MLQRHDAYPNEDDTLVLIRLGIGKEMMFDCTPDQYVDGMNKYAVGMHIQNAFSFLSDDEREFLMTGITSDEWDAMWPKESE